MIQSKKIKGELGKGTQRNFLNCKIEDTRLNNIQYTKLESSFRKMNMWLREVSERENRKIQRTGYSGIPQPKTHTAKLNWPTSCQQWMGRGGPKEEFFVVLDC